MRLAGLLALALLLPASAFAALVNINTATVDLLDTLPGIGPTKAAAIVDYRTEHGPFVRIEDIQNVSGIGPSTYAEIKDLITVGDAAAPPSPPVATSTAQGGSGGTPYTVPPSTLSIAIQGPATAMVHVPLKLSAQATTKGGIVDHGAMISWSFGDGSSQTGTLVEKVYRHPGKYLVTVQASNGPIRARDELVVTVSPAEIRIDSSGEGVVIQNESEGRIDLSAWILLSAASRFRIPEGTILLPQGSVLFSPDITHLPTSLDAELLYPDGLVAARSLSVASPAPLQSLSVQPSLDIERSYSMKAVEPLISEAPNSVPYGEEVHAPAASTELAAAGAALETPGTVPPMSRPNFPGLFSPWVAGLLLVMVLAGVAFIRL